MWIVHARWTVAGVKHACAFQTRFLLYTAQQALDALAALVAIGAPADFVMPESAEALTWSITEVDGFGIHYILA